MEKDGNGVNSGVYYARTTDRKIMMYDPFRYTRYIEKDFNNGKAIELKYVDWDKDNRSMIGM